MHTELYGALIAACCISRVARAAEMPNKPFSTRITSGKPLLKLNLCDLKIPVEHVGQRHDGEDNKQRGGKSGGDRGAKREKRKLDLFDSVFICCK